MTPRAFSIANLSTHQIDRRFDQPWLSAPAIPSFETRDQYKRWLAESTSTVPLFSGIEGHNPAMRVSGANEPHKVHLIVVDYDTPLSDTEVTEGLARVPADFPVYAWNRSRRGGVHMVWALNEPVFYYGKDTYTRFLKQAIKALKLRDLFPGFDEQLLFKPDQTYAAGNNWTVNETALLNPDTVGLWLFEATRKSKDFDKGLEIPLDVVAAEAEKRFPGRWTSPFQEGARGIRFWDPVADNPTAAVVRKTGMTCYTGERPFMSWADIFGPDFIRKYQEDRIGKAVSELWADKKKHYFRKLPSGVWDGCEVSVMRRHLRGVYALSDKGGDALSEVERALLHLELHRRVEGMMPFPHQPEQIVEWNGRTYLNSSLTKLVQPVDETVVEWGDRFPFVAGYIDNLFANETNREFFLAWLQVWYRGAQNGAPQQGQAVFLVGPPGTGKSFLSLELLSSIFGGYANAASFFVEGSQYNEAMFEKALWALDDQTVLGDRRKHAKFSALVKACVANPSMPIKIKYGYEGEAPFNGRFFCTLNGDPVSLGILPNTDGSLLDKVIMLRTGDKEAAVGPDRHRNHEVVMTELPFFLRWLLDWQRPDTIETDTRYGIKSWHDRLVRDEAEADSDSNIVLQAVAQFMETEWTGDSLGDQKDGSWEGNASLLLSRLKANGVTHEMVRHLNPISFGRHLKSAIAGGCDWITRKSKSKNALYRITKPKDEDELDETTV